MIKISCDIDQCICDFWSCYLERFGNPKNDTEITKNVMGKLRKDKNFWMSLPIINRPNFRIGQYTTARSISKSWVKEYLHNNNMPDAPVYQLYCHNLSKVPKIKMGGCDLHIDDSLKVFIDCNLHGIPCLLMDTPANRDWGPIARVYSLDKDEILDSYYLFKDTLFSYFKEILDEYYRRN